MRAETGISTSAPGGATFNTTSVSTGTRSSVITKAPPRPMSRRTPRLSCSVPGICQCTGKSMGRRW